MVTKKKKTTKTKRPSVRATKAAEHLLEVPELMSALSAQMNLMALQLTQMERSIGVLALALSRAPALQKNLLTEPAPDPVERYLVEEDFRCEPKGNIP